MDPPPPADPHLQPPLHQPQAQPVPSYDPYYYYQQPPPQQPPPFDPNEHYSQPYAADPYYHQPYDSYYQPPAPQPLVPQPIPPPAVPHPPGAEPAATSYQQEPKTAYPGQPAINPAAEAAIKALSELTQFADRMCAEERARSGVQWHERSRGMVPAYGTHNQGAQPYPPAPGRAPALMHMEVGGRKQRGRGRRGGVPRGGGRSGSGGFNTNVNGQDGRSPTFRGRGHGSRGGRGRGQHQGLGQEPSSAQTPVPFPAQPKRPIVVAWCDVCRVDCNSLEILEQHKNGKRHKKTVQKLEEMQARQKLLAELEAKRNQEKLDEKSIEQNVATESEKETLEQPGTLIVQQAYADNAKDATEDDGTAEAKQVDDNLEKSEEVNVGPLSETQPGLLPTMPMRGGYGRSRPSRGGLVKIGRAGKRLRNFDSAPNKQPKRPNPKEMPLLCNVCNITCDTQAVFECHLAGKKHLSKIRRFPERVVEFNPPNRILGTQNQQVLSGDPQSNDGSELMAPESTNFQTPPVSSEQVITVYHPDNDKAEASAPTTMTVAPVQENVTVMAEHAALPGSDASHKQNFRLTIEKL